MGRDNKHISSIAHWKELLQHGWSSTSMAFNQWERENFPRHMKLVAIWLILLSSSTSMRLWWPFANVIWLIVRGRKFIHNVINMRKNVWDKDNICEGLIRLFCLCIVKRTIERELNEEIFIDQNSIKIMKLEISLFVMRKIDFYVKKRFHWIDVLQFDHQHPWLMH